MAESGREAKNYKKAQRGNRRDEGNGGDLSRRRNVDKKVLVQ